MTSRMETESWAPVPKLLALSSASEEIDQEAPAKEPGNYAQNYFKSGQWFDSLLPTKRYNHSWSAGLLMAQLSSLTQPIIVFEPS